MSLYTAIVIMRLGVFITGCITYIIASYFNFLYSGWILVPTILAGIMCVTLIVDSSTKTMIKSSTKNYDKKNKSHSSNVAGESGPEAILPLARGRNKVSKPRPGNKE